jgi:cellulose synthase (UDP-forming)
VPIIDNTDTDRANIRLSYLLLLGSVVFGLAFLSDTILVYWHHSAPNRPSLPVILLYALCGGALIFSGIAHLLARLGFHLRLRTEVKESRPAPATTEVGILVPSYREEPDVVHRTLLSAALQTHPRKWITLLLDDPPAPADGQLAALLDAGRSAPDRVRAFLAPLAALAEEALAGEDTRAGLRDLHAACAGYLDAQAAAWPVEDHENRLFASHVLLARAKAHRDRADELRYLNITPKQVRLEVARVAASYTPAIRVFERKRYQNLSHAPNKAMNLNSYIGLLGEPVTERTEADGLHLRPSPDGEAMPSATYIVTLDADSILVPTYVETLVGIMETPGRERLAVVQTPYAATPGAPGRLERIAGATTDVQRLLHQGYTRYEGTFWVGANAVLRVAALRDIRQPFTERGHQLWRFIQDRTVIEDTESTIDLIRRGWSLWNHPEALAYSATPPDFGALVIQRRRWACGGLLILPKAIRALFARRIRMRLPQAIIRLHYLGSLAWVPIAVITLVAFPFPDALDSWFLPFAALPYFIAYALDLRLCGRSPRDLLAVYALNLLLVPVHLSGAAASVVQGLTGRPVPFQRTPKVDGRTAAPWSMLTAIWLAPVLLAFGSLTDFLGGEYVRGTLSTANAVIVLGAATYFIGVRATLEDLRRPLVRVAKSRRPSERNPVLGRLT